MANHHAAEHKHHVTPINVYIKTFGALILLTIITVVTSYFDFGTMNIAVALLIATVKAVLVILFFMQLKYDGMENKVTFVSSFVFLGIFLGLTGSDFVFRKEVTPMVVEQVAGGSGPSNPRELNKANAALISKGKELFAVQCVACHGATGGGDGPAAAALNPKPRNFQSGYWKLGGSPSRIFETLSKGSPGTSMGAFDSLSIEDRYALAHYVRSISKPTPPEDSETDLAYALSVSGGGGPKSISIGAAMELMEEKDQVVLPSEMKNPSHPGAYLYRAQCAQCHGLDGQGAQVKTMGVNPATTLVTSSFVGKSGKAWAQSESEFVKAISQGIPGAMPGMAGYSASEWSNLFGYVRSLTTK